MFVNVNTAISGVCCWKYKQGHSKNYNYVDTGAMVGWWNWSWNWDVRYMSNTNNVESLCVMVDGVLCVLPSAPLAPLELDEMITKDLLITDWHWN